MCDAFRKFTTATWFFIDMKHVEKRKWSNKCLHVTVLRLCNGQVRRHAQRFFNTRCANDVVSRSSFCQCVENLNAVRDFFEFIISTFTSSILSHTTVGKTSFLDLVDIALAPCFGTQPQDMPVLRRNDLQLVFHRNYGRAHQLESHSIKINRPRNTRLETWTRMFI